MHHQKVTVAHRDGCDLERNPMIIVAEVERAVVGDRRVEWRGLVEDKATVCDDVLDLRRSDPVPKGGVREDERHTGDIV